MSAKTNIFFTGATGYVGGSVLLRFLNRPDFASLNITALVRSLEKAEKLKQLGINAVIGSLADLALLEKSTSEADVVIHTADADDPYAVPAMLKGLEHRHEATGTVSAFIHTSGTSVVSDKAAGMYANETIWDDTDADQIETLPPSAVHRLVDLQLLNADKQGYVKTYIILPAPIYGIATGKLVELGIQNPYSVPVPLLIGVAFDRGVGGMVGAGKNISANVQIEEVADLFLVLYNSIRSDPNTGHGREGFYFAASDEHTSYELAKEISKALVEIGRAKTEEPTTYTEEELKNYFYGSTGFGSNTRCRANRSRAIGWAPTRTTADLLASIRPEVEYLRNKTPTEIMARFHGIVKNMRELYGNFK